MTFLTFATGMIVFRLLWGIIPRTSLIVALSIFAVKYRETKLFLPYEAGNVWDGIATLLIMMLFIQSCIVDVNNFRHWWKRSYGTKCPLCQ